MRIFFKTEDELKYFKKGLLNLGNVSTVFDVNDLRFSDKFIIELEPSSGVRNLGTPQIRLHKRIKSPDVELSFSSGRQATLTDTKKFVQVLSVQMKVVEYIRSTRYLHEDIQNSEPTLKDFLES